MIMSTELYFQIAGAVGLLLITGGVLQPTEKRQNILFVFGGFFLLAYSVFLRDPIFVPLQVIFIGASMVALKKNKNR